MKRREFSLSTASAVAACALVLPAANPALAQARQFKGGKDYRQLDKPVAPEAPAGKVDVIEFFWYSCGHCNAFEPTLEAWVKAAPKDLSIRRVPVAFNASFVPQQKLYYTLSGMGKIDELHPRVFRVRVGPFTKRDDAEQLKEKLDGAGLESALVRVQR